MALGVTPGAALFQQKGCFACHRLNEVGSVLGPELTHVGSRLASDAIERILTDPRSVNPQAIMPPPFLSPEERSELARFPVAGLMSLEPPRRVAAAMDRLCGKARELGSPLQNPFAVLSFLALPVIPEIRLTDRGLVEVGKAEIVPLAAA